MSATKWKEDSEFVDWLVKMEYAFRDGDKVNHHFNGDGMILYMWEAWNAAKAIC